MAKSASVKPTSAEPPRNASSIPLRTASDLPTFLGIRCTRTRESAVAIDCKRAKVPSLDPSSTSRTVQPASLARAATFEGSSRCSSLKQGTTMVHDVTRLPSVGTLPTR